MNIPTDYQNLSQIAKAAKKRLGSWVNQPVGKTAIAQFKLDHPEITEPIIVVQGRGKAQGTYAHPLLAAIFAAWCDPKFTKHVVAENALLREKIRTFRFDTPRELETALDEASAVRSLAMESKDKTEEEIVLIAKTHYMSGYEHHPKGHTFQKYLPHWLAAQGHRSDLYPPDVIEAMKEKYGVTAPIDGRKLKFGYSYVWH
jgi:hypothetical protein